jgi:tetratricopeptide (TPR) repeat protein
MRVVVAALLASLIPSMSWALPPPPLTDEERREKIEMLLDGPDEPLPPGNDQRMHYYEAAKERAVEAQEHIKELLAKTPNDPDLHWLAGVAAMAISDGPGPSHSPRKAVEEAIAEMEKSRQLAPHGAHARGIADALGILYSKLDQHDRALAEYDRAIQLRLAEGDATDGDTVAANLYGNSAEALMGLGRLGESIARYRRAAELSVNEPRTRSLAFFGLGVALDRDEQLEKSRDAIRQALVTDPTSLDSVDVFFMPEGDKFYYVALGFLVRDNPAAAALAFHEFLARLPNSRYAARAKAHLAEIGSPHVAGLKSPGIRVSASVTSGATSNFRELLSASEPRLATCFKREKPPARVLGPLIVDLSESRTERTLNVRVSAKNVANDPLDEQLEGCIETIAREWRPLLDEYRHARVILRVEYK